MTMLSLTHTPLASLKKNLGHFYKSRIAAYEYAQHEINHPGDYESRNCFDYYKCIFVHIPKTGGKSISKTLFGNFGGGHVKVGAYIKIFGERTFNRYYKFTFVRNPWDRLYSAYNYYIKGTNEYAKDERWRVEYLFYKEHLSHLRSFEQFVMEWLDEEKTSGLCIHFIPQHHMVTTLENRDQIRVDFIGRFENIEEDFRSLCMKLKRPTLQLQRINITNLAKDAFNTVYTKEMIDKVARVYAKDIELFNYSFPEM